MEEGPIQHYYSAKLLPRMKSLTIPIVTFLTWMGFYCHVSPVSAMSFSLDGYDRPQSLGGSLRYRRSAAAAAASAASSSGGGGAAASSAASSAVGGSGLFGFGGASSAASSAASSSGTSGGFLTSRPAGTVEETFTTEVISSKGKSGGGLFSGLASFGGAIKEGLNNVVVKPTGTLMASAGEVTEAVGVTTTEVATNGAQMVTSGVTGSGSVAKAVGTGVINTVGEVATGIVETGSSLGTSTSSGGTDTVIQKTTHHVVHGSSAAVPVVQTVSPAITTGSSESVVKKTEIVQGVSGKVSTPSSVVVTPSTSTIVGGTESIVKQKQVVSDVVVQSAPKTTVISTPTVLRSGGIGAVVSDTVQIKEKQKIEKDVYVKQSSSNIGGGAVVTGASAGAVVPTSGSQSVAVGQKTIVEGSSKIVGSVGAVAAPAVGTVVQTGMQGAEYAKSAFAKGKQIAGDILSPTIQGVKESASRASKVIANGAGTAASSASAAATSVVGGAKAVAASSSAAAASSGSASSSAASSAAVSVSASKSGGKVASASAAAAASASSTASASAAASSQASKSKPIRAPSAKPKPPCPPTKKPPCKVCG
ncbi:hypothetical protein M8J76_000267 [Diaphorina citri]|nr:hypothetical protein M8J76_000267 [Diaphorina citri]